MVKITVLKIQDEDYISLTDMLKSKDGDFFISDWLRNRNTIEYLGVWEKIHNPNFNYGEFATITSKAGWYSGTYAHKDIEVINIMNEYKWLDNKIGFNNDK